MTIAVQVYPSREDVGGMLDAHITKLCTTCTAAVPLPGFRPRKTGRLKLHSECRACNQQRSKNWQNAHPERSRRNRELWTRNNRARRSLVNSLTQALKRRPSQNPVTIEYVLGLLEQQDGRCVLSGVILTFGGGLNWSSCSMDRIEQAAGYEIGNVRLIAHAVNAFRGKMTDEQMWVLVDMMHAKRPQ